MITIPGVLGHLSWLFRELFAVRDILITILITHDFKKMYDNTPAYGTALQSLIHILKCIAVGSFQNFLNLQLRVMQT